MALGFEGVPVPVEWKILWAAELVLIFCPCWEWNHNSLLIMRLSSVGIAFL